MYALLWHPLEHVSVMFRSGRETHTDTDSMGISYVYCSSLRKQSGYRAG
jgi:hypothetical protein